MMKKLTIEQFIERSVTLYGNRYNLSEANYENTHKKVKITCNDHNVGFLQSPGTFLQNRHGSNRCSKEKTKQTNLEHYGVENPMQAPKIQEKSKQTLLQKYNIEYISQKHISLQRLRLLNNPQIYMKLGYNIKEQPPHLYSEDVWDCGKMTLNRVSK